MLFSSEHSNQLQVTDADSNKDMDGRTRDCCIYPSEEFNQLEATDANGSVRQ